MKQRVTLRQYPLINVLLLNSIQHTTIMIEGIGEFSFSIRGLEIGNLNLGEMSSEPIDLGETSNGHDAIKRANEYYIARPYNIVDYNCNTFCGYMASVLGVRQPPSYILDQYKNKQQQFNRVTSYIAKYSTSFLNNIFSNKDGCKRNSYSYRERRF